jgi:hypothetical protein
MEKPVEKGTGAVNRVDYSLFQKKNIIGAIIQICPMHHHDQD